MIMKKEDADAYHRKKKNRYLEMLPPELRKTVEAELEKMPKDTHGYIDFRGQMLKPFDMKEQLIREKAEAVMKRARKKHGKLCREVDHTRALRTYVGDIMSSHFQLIKEDTDGEEE